MIKKLEKKWVKMTLKVLVLLIIACGFVGGCSLINKKLGLSDDNVAEELFEEIIQENTGLDLDLSPESKEEYEGHAYYKSTIIPHRLLDNL